MSRVKALMSTLPIVVIVWVGFYSHRHYGHDGIAGVLLGHYWTLFMLIVARKWKREELSPFRRFVHRFRTPFMVLGLFTIILGALDMAGIL